MSMRKMCIPCELKSRRWILLLVYEAFLGLAHADRHLAGESYAGRFVPAFASAILEYNQFSLRSCSRAYLDSERISQGQPEVPIQTNSRKKSLDMISSSIS
jgi:hypothetical protein